MIRRRCLALFYALVVAFGLGLVAPSPAQSIINRPRMQQMQLLRSFLPVNSSPIASIASSGWQADTPSTPSISSPLPLSLSRQGYDGSGNTTTISDTVYVTTRVRLPYPNQASLTASTVALSDYVYSTDTAPGVVNNSAEASPKAVANFATLDQKVVGNTIGGSVVPIEVVAFHRNGIADVRYLISDGTTTITVNVPTISKSTNYSTDQGVVQAYILPATDISALANSAVITVNAEVYPRVGSSASILRSADSAVAREFSPRYFFKDTAKAAAPPYVCVNATTGVDVAVLASGATSGGVVKVSTNPATACANPFATLASTTGAARALQSATMLTGGVTSGAIIRIQGSVPNSTAWTTGTYQNTNGGSLTIEADPADSTAVVTAPVANNRQLYLLYRNIKLSRTTTGASPSLRAENVQIDNAGQTTAMVSTSIAANGLTITNAAGNILGASTAYEDRLLRGLSVSGTAPTAIEGYLVLGSNFQNGASLGDVSARPANGGITAFNRFQRVANQLMGFGQSYNLTGYAFVSNLSEYVGSAATDTNRFGGDSGIGNVTNLIVAYNTFTGFNEYHRHNWAYVDGTLASGAQSRVHKLWLVRQNIFTQVNMKGDVFVATNNNGTPDPTNAPNATGNWSQRYGVGWAYNWSQYVAADGGVVGQGAVFSQDYAGRGSIYGTSNTVRNDPLWTDYRGTTNTGSTGVAGPGGGTYTLQAGSPVIGLMAANDNEFLPWDIDGNVRDRRSAGVTR